MSEIPEIPDNVVYQTVPVHGVRDRWTLLWWGLRHRKSASNPDRPSRLRLVQAALRAKTVKYGTWGPRPR